MTDLVYYIVKAKDGTRCEGPILVYDDAYWCWAEKYNGSEAFVIISVDKDNT